MAQTLLKILDIYSRYLLKKHLRTTATYTSYHTSSTWEYVLRNILVPPLTSRLLAIVFNRKWNFSRKCRFSPKISRIGKNEFHIRFLRHFLHSIRKTCIFGFTCPLKRYVGQDTSPPLSVFIIFLYDPISSGPTRTTLRPSLLALAVRPLR